MAKLSDIAAMTGVGIATVSKALRGRDDISAKTRKRILEAARALGYLPRSVAKAGAAGQAFGSVGVICPEIRSAYYAQIVSALEAQFRERGWGMTLGLTEFSYDREARFLERFLRQQVAGIVCITEGAKIEYDLRTFRSVHGIPVVVVATVIAIEDFDYVKVNDDLGVRLAVHHLVELGHGRIGFVGDTVSRQRMEVFTDALRRHRVAVPEAFLKLGEERFEVGGYLRMKELLRQRPRPTAVVAAYDDVAIGAMRAAHEAGLAVPADLSIVGIDGIEVGAYLPTPLTTVASHTVEMAEAARRILLKKIDTPSFTVVQHVEINPELIVRQSTARPPPARSRR